ncbi:hypothetical protein QAD02_002437 [Eretmocerus hayati]|uniref:Uncharacterized protein n=1 Tax=Eretmocerus hayati TaxID=131215 RepID=A0ACC2NK30_9HYME|nr:hypothetical protein QAD02_002437 [Eretmocerus hayati]
MLLLGRPFAIEFSNPRANEASQHYLTALEENINSGTQKINVRCLKIITRNDFKLLKEGERFKNKSYRALCFSRGGVQIDHLIHQLQGIRSLKVTQFTPVRVLHRRTSRARQRIIHEIRGRKLSEQELHRFDKFTRHTTDVHSLLMIDLKTQAGTYIKEFIHGDFGRTTPSLSDILGSQLDILALDVTHIGLQWP